MEDALQILRDERALLIARRDEMAATLEGCDWCCGGGDEEWNQIDERLHVIDALLHPTENN